MALTSRLAAAGALQAAMESMYAYDINGNVVGLAPPTGATILFDTPSYTFANLPDATTNAGLTARVTDIGMTSVGTLWMSDGLRWIPVNGSAFVSRTSIPMIVPSSGTMGNNGAITLTTALPIIYPKCYIYLPVNAISAGSAAGLYYAIMSSTTVGVVYNNTYTGGYVLPPASPTAFVTTGPGAYSTITATDFTLLSTTIPANALGVYGGIRCNYTATYNNTAGLKSLKSKYGSYAFHTLAPSTSVVLIAKSEMVNAGVSNRQVSLVPDSASGFAAGGSVALNAVGAVDSTTSQTVLLTAQLATATDFMVLVCGSIEITG